MSFDKIVEAIIQEAMARGEFENLPGQGKPIDLTEYFDTPEDIRMAQTLLKNAGLAPVEIDLLREIAALKDSLSAAKDEAQAARIRKQLHEKQLELNLSLERRRRK